MVAQKVPLGGEWVVLAPGGTRPAVAKGRPDGAGRVRWGYARRVLAAALVVALGAALGPALGPARAQGLAAASGRFDAGAFVEAYDLAAAFAAAQGDTAAAARAHALAARAALAHVLYDPPSDDVGTWMQRARDASLRAEALAPDDSHVLVTVAQVRGELALRSGALANLDAAGEIHDALEHALAIAPDDPDALVGMGMWHLELIDRGVGWLYGARRDGALEQVARGVSLAPDRISLRIQYAKALRITGDVAGAREQLRTALALPAGTAEDRFEQRRAEALLRDM